MQALQSSLPAGVVATESMLIKTLKVWCLNCKEADDRNSHMDPKTFRRLVEWDSSDADLDARLEAL